MVSANIVFNQKHTLSLTAHAIFPPKFGGDEMNFTRVFVSRLIREDPGTEVAAAIILNETRFAS